MCILVYTYVYVCVRVRVYVRMHVWVFSVHLYLFVCIGCVLQHFGFVWWDRTSYRRPGPDSGSCRCGPDTMGIRRPMHGMVRRPVPVRAVKTRRRFGSETASFHVSVRFCVFTVVGMPYMLILSFHVTFRYILSVWLLVPLH